MKTLNLKWRVTFLALAAFAVVLSAVRPALSALESNIVVLDRAGIKALEDDKLLDNYIDVIVELKAIESFHTTSGFTPKEYDNYKSLLRYKILLLDEVETRKLRVPHMEQGSSQSEN